MRSTLREAVAALFQQRPETWIDGHELMKVGGYSAWRTRVSECRRELGMRIDNRVRPVLGDDGRVKYRITEYIYREERHGERQAGFCFDDTSAAP